MDVAPLDTLKTLQEFFCFFFFPLPSPFDKSIPRSSARDMSKTQNEEFRNLQHETAECRAQPMQCNTKTPVHHTPAFSKPLLKKTQKWLKFKQSKTQDTASFFTDKTMGQLSTDSLKKTNYKNKNKNSSDTLSHRRLWGEWKLAVILVSWNCRHQYRSGSYRSRGCLFTKVEAAKRRHLRHPWWYKLQTSCTLHTRKLRNLGRIGHTSKLAEAGWTSGEGLKGWRIFIPSFSLRMAATWVDSGLPDRFLNFS